MSLKLAFVLDPLDVLKAWKDSSVGMMRAAEKQGHEVFAIDAATLDWRQPEADAAGGVFGEAVHLALRPDDHDWFRELGCEIRPLTDFDAVIMRKDPPFDFEYLTATWLLERAEAMACGRNTAFAIIVEGAEPQLVRRRYGLRRRRSRGSGSAKSMGWSFVAI